MFELHNAGIGHPVYHERRLRYIQEFLTQFPDEDADTYVMFIRGQGEALWELGRRAEAEAVYAALVERYPDKGWAHIGWSDHYWQWGAPDPKEYDRAEAILQQALVRPRLEDRNDALDRLCSLYGEWGQKDKRAEAVAQLEQATKQADAPRYFPDLPKPLSPTRPIASQPKKPGRNESCWCGSGKKYKHCYMKADQSGEHL
jgi:tetratricopeptide (TPR) repeat protein